MYTELIYKVITEILGRDIFYNYSRDYIVRIMVQKIMYIFQESIKKDLFGYSLYVNGPYSPNIHNVIINRIIPNLEIKKYEWDSIEFSKQGLFRIKKVKDLLVYSDIDKIKIGLEQLDFFELISSMLYIYNNYSEDKDIIIKKLNYKFDKIIIEYYWHRIIDFINEV